MKTPTDHQPRLKSLCEQIDAAYVVIRKCTNEAAAIIYGYEGKEKVGDLMDDLALSDAQGGSGSDAEGVLLFLYRREKIVKEIKAIMKEAEMDIGELQSYLSIDAK
jgi:hypothetical protein